ncbi:divergent polysaccharide deacetylase family protein [Cytobacillus massiliigabonensis]|uniref:divergent polysaccharide deacetylase family protein n=1 Tax=Cytobacillus massiliigabonensis TaxID=1871011 RepID=UPI000C84BBB6|nr:divergent polysaccharide deacetylase family protein [Cytobacillus massiliigabonensis]
MKQILCLLALLFLLNQPQFTEASQIKRELAIVIDDLGNNMLGTEEILELPITLTAAIMPFMPSTKADAEMAKRNGHEVIVHLPMEPKKGKKSWLGPGAITTDLSDEEIRKRVVAAIKDVPHATGMNHHMGSKATENERVMRIVLEVCKEYGFFYLDSKTTANSVVWKIANQLNIPYLENNLFFDDVYTTRHVTKQANLLAGKLNKSEQIIAIGHVGVSGPIMASVLEAYIPVYKNKAELVPLSKLIPGYELLDEGI